MNAERPALLLIGHGSRSQAGVAEYWSLVEALRGQDPSMAIGGGFIELARPNLDSAIDELAAAGRRSVVAVPLLLLGAGHQKDDGPAALARARIRHPGVEFLYGRALGIHPLVLAVARDRIAEALGRTSSRDAAVVLVGRGSSDPDANADLYKAARLLQEMSGGSMVEPAFVSLAAPSLPDALERCRRLGATAVAVVPYFLFTGVLVDRIADQARGWEASAQGTRVVVGGHLGPEPGIARLVHERYHEALAGDTRMNCDCCVHRVAASPGPQSDIVDGHGRRVRFLG
ncbi:MAG TPA: sirohydrochlorin chelatase [Acidimicrobiales bacterium]|nr:sirohydrochlorin chelatase [Acidimicrobiales bacterium]